MSRNKYSQKATDDNIIWRMRFTFWISKATNTISEYVTLTALFKATVVTLILYVTFVRTLPLFLFVATNGRVLCRKVRISMVNMIINLSFLVSWATVLMCYCINVLLYYCVTVLLYYCINVLLYYCVTVLMCYCITVLLYYCVTVLMCYCITVLLYSTH